MRRQGLIWVCRIAAVVLIAALAAYLWSVGFDKADKLAGVLVLLVALATLVAPYLFPFPASGDTAPKDGQHVSNAVVKGHLTQLRSPKREYPSAADTGVTAERESGQYVDGVWVGGNVTQIDGVGGDVTIE